VVWISPEIRDEHKEALDWLNRHTDEQINFFGVAIKLIRIDGSNPAVEFRPVAYPSKWRPDSIGKQTSVSNRALAYQAFFQALIYDLREKHKYTNAKIAQPQSWYNFSSGVANITYGAVFAQGDRLRAEVYIDTGDTSRNKAIFDWLLEHKVDIEAQMKQTLDWQRLDNRRASRIAAVRPNVKIADAAAHSNEWRDWLIERLIRLKSVFGPLLREALAATLNVATTEPELAEELEMAK
jgi:hypothetical protein